MFVSAWGRGDEAKVTILQPSTLHHTKN